MQVELRLFIAFGTGYWHNNESHWVATAAYGDFATTGVGVPGALLFDGLYEHIHVRGTTKLATTLVILRRRFFADVRIQWLDLTGFLTNCERRKYLSPPFLC